MALVTAAGRMDAVSLVYTIFLLILVLIPSRAAVKRQWYVFLLVVGISLPVQYASAIGLPPNLCVGWN